LSEITSLSGLASSFGFLHCLAGPDHYVPFVAMSRVGLWSLRKTLIVTALCGVGHILSSALLGFIGVALGLVVKQLEDAESIRGGVAGWLLVAFGAGYTVWGIVYAVRRRRADRRREAASAGTDGAEAAAEAVAARAGSMTPWILFVVFVFGPCEPLIPVLMYPAAKASVWLVVWVTLLFGLTTLITMLTLVTIIYRGAAALQFRWAEVYGHALAGLLVLACGLAIKFGL